MIASCCVWFFAARAGSGAAGRAAGWACFLLLPEFRAAVCSAGCLASFPLAAAATS
jgi:hypothetical protein